MRASKDEEQLFLRIGMELVSSLKEPSNWKKPRNPKKHAGGKPVSYHFKPMLLVLLLTAATIITTINKSDTSISGTTNSGIALASCSNLPHFDDTLTSPKVRKNTFYQSQIRAQILSKKQDILGTLYSISVFQYGESSTERRHENVP